LRWQKYYKNKLLAKKMRSLFFDELRTDELRSIENYLNSNTLIGPIKGLYWLTIPDEILTDEQKDLQKKIGQFKIAIELGKTWIKFELLIRSSSIQNEGYSLTNIDQLNYIYQFADKMAKTLNLITCI
jgi:hypothetical protein